MNCGFGDFEGTENTLSVFAVYAAEQPDGGGYKVPVVAWVHERETSDRLRRFAMGGLKEAAQVERGGPQERIFESRVQSFLYDNERNEVVHMSLGGKRLEIGKTNEGGFTSAVLTLPAKDAGKHVETVDGERRLNVSFSTGATSGRAAVPVIPAEGVSVISDIDDTIKVTEVLDREAMVQNTFMREFQAVPVMPALYRKWASAGHVFHYVSAGPWQLAEHLQPFLDQEGFPSGVLHLRELRLKSGSSLHAFLTESAASKTERIEDILRLFPKRRFILVGDSGEKDPEIYGALARRFPKQVQAIYIRKVPGAPNTQARFGSAFDGVPAAKVKTFDDPAEVEPEAK